MRHGPRPLSVNIALALSRWAYAHGNNAKEPYTLPHIFSDMLLGIRAYQNHPYTPERQPLKNLWTEGTVTVNALPSHEYEYNKDNPALILIPSLINRSHIFDLTPDRSLLRWLSSQRINTYLLDWGQSTDDADQADLDSLIAKRLAPALSFLNKHTGQSIHALGYCMGGTILAGAAAHMSMPIRSLVFLASPWDFHAGSQHLLNLIRFWAPSILPLFAEKKNLSAERLQILFASLDPEQSARKFARFYETDHQSDESKLFIAVEDWLNDGIDLPHQIAHRCMVDWYLENKPAQKKWIIGEDAVDPKNITCPSLIIASSKDKLVEIETATPLAEQIGTNAATVNPGCGHIGMIAGRHAVQKVWEPIAQWIRMHHES